MSRSPQRPRRPWSPRLLCYTFTAVPVHREYVNYTSKHSRTLHMSAYRTRHAVSPFVRHSKK